MSFRSLLTNIINIITYSYQEKCVCILDCEKYKLACFISADKTL